MADEAEHPAVTQSEEPAGGEAEDNSNQEEDQTTGHPEAEKRELPITTTTTIAAPADSRKTAEAPDPVPIENVIDASTDVSKQAAEQESEAGDSGSDDAADDADDEIVKDRSKMVATGKDFYCWHCHKERGNLSCSACPRSYHRKCLPANFLFEGQTGSKKSAVMSAEMAAKWMCPECKLVQEGEDKRRTCLSRVSDEEFNQLLISALGTIKSNAESQFYFPVSDTDFPEYKKFILHPMDFAAIDRNVRRGVYKSTDAFTADVKWIVHNCYIYNSANHILTKNANYFFKVTKTEMGELEVCPDCFRNYYQFNKTYFVETCKSPHRLVWARLKGHPFWPAKLVRIDAVKKEGDCRFFGAHDRAWVPFESIFLLSEQYPWTKSKSHKSKLDAALSEARAHIEKLSLQFPGLFRYADPKTQFKYANACLTSDELMSIDAASGIRVTESPVARQPATGLKRQAEKQQKSETPEMITQNKEGDGMLLLDDEERPLIIDAPVDEKSVGSASAIKRKSGDSGKNKAISTPVKRNSSTASAASASNPGNGSGVRAAASNSTTTALASKKASLSQKSKIPTKKAISTATTASSSRSLTNCQPVTTSARGAGKRKESPSSLPAPTTQKQATADTDLSGKKVRIVNTGSKSGNSAAVSTSPAKRKKLPDARSQESLLSGTKAGKNATGVSSGANNNKNSSSSHIAAVTHAANGSLPATAPSSIPIQITSDSTEFPSQSQQSPSSSPGTSLPGSTVRSNSSTAANSHSSIEVKKLRDEIKRLKDQVSKLTVEMREVKDLTETRITKASQEKDKALSDQESRLSKSFASQLEDTKRNQWCANCLKSSILFCCWNCSYCSYDCQSKHWPTHMSSCQQYSKTSATSSMPVSSSAAAQPPPTQTVKSVKTEDK